MESKSQKPKWQRARHVPSGTLIWVKNERPHCTRERATGEMIEMYSMSVADPTSKYGLWGVSACDVELLPEFGDEEVIVYPDREAALLDYAKPREAR
jgi:hypothetical protein